MADDQLTPIVQKMIDAGESEENIATVIQHFKTQTPQLSAVSNEEPGTFTGGFVKSLKDQVGEAFAGAKPMLESAAHPQTAGDFAQLLVPSTALGTGLRSLRGYVGAAKNLFAGAAEGAANREGLKKGPAVLGGMLRTATDPASGGERAFQQAPLSQQMESLPAVAAPERMRSSGPPIANLGNEAPQVPPAPIAAPAATEAVTGGLSATDKAVLAKQHYSPEVIAKIVEQQLAPQQGRLRTASPSRMLPPEDPAMAEIADRLAGGPDLPTPDNGTYREPPLQQPRVQQGAQRVGRAEGLTKEQVRAQTAPILGEAPGEASPILPRAVLGKIVDTVKALPPSEREAYVARATSGKAQWQIENIRRTLEHLGLLVAGATGAGALRREALLTGGQP
jgi:hypothetical protein